MHRFFPLLIIEFARLYDDTYSTKHVCSNAFGLTRHLSTIDAQTMSLEFYCSSSKSLGIFSIVVPLSSVLVFIKIVFLRRINVMERRGLCIILF